MTLCVSVIGIDGSGKGSNINSCIHLLYPKYPSLVLGWKAVNYIYKERVYSLLDRSTQRYEILVPDPLYKSPTVLERLLISWYRLRKQSLIKSLKPVYCFEDRDLLVDPLILATSYLGILRRLSISIRIRCMQLVTGARLADCYVYLDVNPETALKRIIQRHKLEGKRLSKHENLQDLRSLQFQYEKALDYLQSQHVPVIRINTENKSVASCSRQIVAAIDTLSRVGKK